MRRNFTPLAMALLLAIFSWRQPLIAQESDVQCVLDAINDAELGVFTRAECTILDHLFIVEYDDPELRATVRGPVVNTSRTFNIPRTFGRNFKIAGTAKSQQEGKEEAIIWVISVYEQIVSGLSLSAIAPSTNAALNSTLRTFSAVVMPNVSPQSRAEDDGETSGVEMGGEESGEAQGEKRDRRAAKPGEISADVEYETFAFVGNDGNTLAFRGAFERTTDSGGMGFGLRLAYTQVTFDKNDNKLQTGEATAFLKIPLADFLEIGGNVSGTVSRIKTFSDLRPDGYDQNVNSLGYGPFVSLHTVFGAGHMLAGGLMYQIINPHEEFDPDKENMRVLAYGALAVFCVSEKLALSVEGFRMSNLEIEEGDDTFTVLHPQLHFFISDSFGLILGYKTVLGIDDYDSTEFTLGSSVRF